MMWHKFSNAEYLHWPETGEPHCPIIPSLVKMTHIHAKKAAAQNQGKLAHPLLEIVEPKV